LEAASSKLDYLKRIQQQQSTSTATTTTTADTKTSSEVNDNKTDEDLMAMDDDDLPVHSSSLSPSAPPANDVDLSPPSLLPNVALVTQLIGQVGREMNSWRAAIDQHTISVTILQSELHALTNPNHVMPSTTSSEVVGSGRGGDEAAHLEWQKEWNASQTSNGIINMARDTRVGRLRAQVTIIRAELAVAIQVILPYYQYASMIMSLWCVHCVS
jgi:hypothetical protein